MKTAPLIVTLLAAWLLGLLTSVTFGGLIHVLPLLAAVAAALHVLRSDRAKQEAARDATQAAKDSERAATRKALASRPASHDEG